MPGAEQLLWTLPDTPPLDGDQQAPTEEASAAPSGTGVAVMATSRHGTPSGRFRLAAGALCLILVGGVAGGVVGAHIERSSSDAKAVPGATIVSSGSGGLDVGAVLAAVENAVVDIQARGQRSTGQGSGIVYSADGLVLTNAHVVEGATQVTVTIPTDRQPRAATIIGADVAHDIAVIKINDPSGLVVAQLGDSDSVKVGADVVAIGNALALRGDPSVTRGIVSARDRSIGELTGMIQTDAAINPGNSGGPLVNAAGQVIGINTAIAVEAGAQNIGFAIPIDAAKQIAARLQRGEQAAPAGFLGVSSGDATASATGAVIASVVAGGPAAAAGLVPGDIIVSIDGHVVTGAAGLSRLIGDHKPGDRVTLGVVRGASDQSVTVVLAARPAG